MLGSNTLLQSQSVDSVSIKCVKIKTTNIQYEIYKHVARTAAAFVRCQSEVLISYLVSVLSHTHPLHLTIALVYCHY
jgi:hypothetical protein